MLNMNLISRGLRFNSRWSLNQTACGRRSLSQSPFISPSLRLKFHGLSPQSLAPQSSLFHSSTSFSNDLKDPVSFSDAHFGPNPNSNQKAQEAAAEEPAPSPTEHAVISTFDLFSIGIGPSSSHTVGPMRAGSIFVSDLQNAGLLEKCHSLKISLYGSLAATGEGHLTPSALLLGLEGADCETVDTESVGQRFEEIKQKRSLRLGRETREANGGIEVKFDYEKDLTWMWGQTLPLHSNGMRLSVFNKEGDLIGTNDYYSIGGGFVINGSLATSSSTSSDPPEDNSSPSLFHPNTPLNHPSDLSENIFYKSINRDEAESDRRAGSEIGARESSRTTLGGPHSLTEPVHRIEGGRPEYESESLRRTAPTPAGQKQVEGYGYHASRVLDPENQNEDSFHATAASHSKEDTSEYFSSGISSSGESESKQSKTNDQKESQVPYPFYDAASLLALCKKHNLTIAQLVYENERHWYSHEEITEKIFKIWGVMDTCIKEGCHADDSILLPGSLRLKKRAPGLYVRLMRGFYPTVGAPVSHSRSSTDSQPPLSGMGPGDSLPTPATSASSSSRPPGHDLDALQKSKVSSSRSKTDLTSKPIVKTGPPRVHGNFNHPIMPIPPRRTVFPAMDWLSTYAIAVNEQNAGGGRVVTAPTNGAAGVIPSVLKYVLEFISEDPYRDVQTFILTSSAIGMLYKRGSTISAAEGGCMAEVGVACSMAAAAFAACMGASPEVIENAAEIGIEHNLGLTCDPIAGLVQAPCIERNALGAVKAVVSAQLALASGTGQHAVSLDDAISAMKVTAKDMHTKYKETSLSGLATSVRIPVAIPDC